MGQHTFGHFYFGSYQVWWTAGYPVGWRLNRLNHSIHEIVSSAPIHATAARGAGGPAAARGAFSFSLLLLAGICRRAAPFTTTCDVLTRVHIYLL